MAEESLCGDAARSILLASATAAPPLHQLHHQLPSHPHRFVDTNGVHKYPECATPNNNLCSTAASTPPDCYDINECANKRISAERHHGVQDSPDSVESGTTTTSQESSSVNEFSAFSLLPEPSTLPKENKVTKGAAAGGGGALAGVDGSRFSNGATADRNNRVRKRASATTATGRGRPRKALVAMYHSQISGDKNTIKIRIRKSNLSTTHTQLTPNKKKSGRRKRHKTSDTDTSDHEAATSAKRTKSAPLTGGAQDVNATDASGAPLAQSAWGVVAPPSVLLAIFQYVVARDGALPAVVRLAKVCRLWRDVVADGATLWRKCDLNAVKERARTDYRLNWLVQHRLPLCEDLSLGEWKVRDIQATLEEITAHCPRLRGLNLSGWKGLNADNLKYITTECAHLQRLDLSSINSTSAINAQPLVSLGQTMNSRLTHLVLAHNKIAGFTQIMASIAGNCANLELLDISNIRTFAHNTALLHVEKLQIGCPRLRVLRMTNSQIWLAAASLTDQVASPGFPCLEELSLAGIEDDKTTTARCVDDDGIERILKHSTKLRLLDVRGCIRLTDSGLVKVPAWDLEHLFLSACLITRSQNSGLELILQKWSHSLHEVDLAWSTATESLDSAVVALTEAESPPLRTINLCGSSVSLEPVKALLNKCPRLHSINLQSCRALPRGIKRLYTGAAVGELRQALRDKPRTEDSAGSDSEQAGPAAGDAAPA